MMASDDARMRTKVGEAIDREGAKLRLEEEATRGLALLVEPRPDKRWAATLTDPARLVP
jgi:hypothetical protein